MAHFLAMQMRHNLLSELIGEKIKSKIQNGFVVRKILPASMELSPLQWMESQCSA